MCGGDWTCAPRGALVELHCGGNDQVLDQQPQGRRGAEREIYLQDHPHAEPRRGGDWQLQDFSFGGRSEQIVAESLLDEASRNLLHQAVDFQDP